MKTKPAAVEEREVSAKEERTDLYNPIILLVDDAPAEIQFAHKYCKRHVHHQDRDEVRGP